MTEPTTAAGPDTETWEQMKQRTGDRIPRHDGGCQCWPHVSESDAIQAITDVELAEYRSARQQDASALRLLRMAAPRLAIGGAAVDAWLFEVRAFLKTAALPPSAPPALDVERLTEAIAEAMNHVPWLGERGSISFGGLTFAASAQAIAAEYARLEQDHD